MKMFPIIIDKLFNLGFKEPDGEFSNTYRYFLLEKNYCQLAITYKFNDKHQIIEAYVEFNGELLMGKKITFLDIEKLIEIM